MDSTCFLRRALNPRLQRALPLDSTKNKSKPEYQQPWTAVLAFLGLNHLLYLGLKCQCFLFCFNSVQRKRIFFYKCFSQKLQMNAAVNHHKSSIKLILFPQAITLPPVSKWPQQTGFSFSTWICLDTSHIANAQRCKPHLYW